MSRFIPDEIIEEVRSANDIVNVVADYVRLKKQGRNFVGLCPFHHEKTPSFLVNPDRQTFHCFGCSTGGNVFTFIMKHENLEFPEAVRLLADKAGITVPEYGGSAPNPVVQERERIFEINELTKNFFQYFLAKHKVGQEARDYLKRRGMADRMIEEFQLGFAPPAWDKLLQFLKKKGYPAEHLEKAGLVLPKTGESGGFYDRFRNRVMFPVWNEKGKVAGFGGRVLDNSLPKYLNSPETPVFNKSSLLYGLHKAAGNIRQQDHVIMVEGYLDVIACHQAGITNVVASLGTALTREQGKLLQRFTREVTIAYDADAAGVNAAVRGLHVLNELGFRVKVISIPDGKDPDEFIKKHGPDKFLALVQEQALSLLDYLTERAMEKFDFYTLEGKFKIASEVIPILRNMSNEIEKDEAAHNLARKLQLSPEAIKAEVEKSGPNARNSWGKRDKITGSRDNNTVNGPMGEKRPEDNDARTKAEDVLLWFMLKDEAVFRVVTQEIGVHFSSRPEYSNIIETLKILTEEQADAFDPSRLFDRLQKPEAVSFLSALMVETVPEGDQEKILRDCLNRIKDDTSRKKREELLRKMEEADKNKDQAYRQKLLEEYSRLI